MTKYVCSAVCYLCLTLGSNVGRHKIFSLEYYFNWKMKKILENDPNLDLEICIVQL